MRRDAGPARHRPALALVAMLLAALLAVTVGQAPAQARVVPSHHTWQGGQEADRERLLGEARKALTRWNAQLVTIEDSAEQVNALKAQIGVLQARIAGLDRHRQAVSNELVGAEAASGDRSLAGFRTVAARFFNSFATALSGALGGSGDQRDYGAVLFELPQAVDEQQRQSGQLQAEQQALQALYDRLDSDKRQTRPEVKKLADRLANRDEQARRKSYEKWRKGVKEQFGAVTSGPLQPADAARGALTFALRQLGRPYQWGATGPNTYDCSGLTITSYRTMGVSIPRVSRDQARFGQPVAFNNLVGGDLVFFGNPVHHVGMYYKDGLMVHAPQTGDVVRVASIMRSGYAGARRMVGAVSGPAVGLPVVPALPPPAAVTTPELRAPRPLSLSTTTGGPGGTTPGAGGTPPPVSPQTTGRPGSTSGPGPTVTQTSRSQTTVSETSATEPPPTEPPPTEPPRTEPPPTTGGSPRATGVVPARAPPRR